MPCSLTSPTPIRYATTNIRVVLRNSVVAISKGFRRRNQLVDFSTQALAAVAYHGLGWLEFPEDLGECKHGVPASVWNWPSLTELAKVGYLRGALYQCEWSSINFRKPTGILSNIAGFMSDPDLHPGWQLKLSPGIRKTAQAESIRVLCTTTSVQTRSSRLRPPWHQLQTVISTHFPRRPTPHLNMCSKLAGYFVEALVI